MDRTRAGLAAVGLLALLVPAVFGMPLLSLAALLMICAASAAYIYAVYSRVRAERKVREKEQILQRVATLEGRHATSDPTTRHEDERVVSRFGLRGTHEREAGPIPNLGSSD